MVSYRVSVAKRRVGLERAAEPADDASMWKRVRHLRRRWLALLVVLAVGLGVVAVIAKSHERKGASVSLAPSSSPTPTTEGEVAEPASRGGCTSRHTGGDIEVTFYGNGQAPCEAFDHGAAKAEEFWQAVSTVMRVHPLCSMSKGSLFAEVRFSGFVEGEAERLCAHFAATGWTEAEGPGEQAEARKAQEEAEQKAAQEREQRARRAEEERREAAENSRREAREKVERAHEEAKQRQEEAQQKAQEQAEERKNQEEQRRSEEETRRSEREVESSK
jgi:flagellar biosynthesis GTPase FlhF